MVNWQKLIDWIKQPSTLKALVIAAGMAGINISPEMQSKILFIGGVLYAGLSAFYDQQPRKPEEPAAPEDQPLTEARFREMLAEAKAKQKPPA